MCSRIPQTEPPFFLTMIIIIYICEIVNSGICNTLSNYKNIFLKTYSQKGKTTIEFVPIKIYCGLSHVKQLAAAKKVKGNQSSEILSFEQRSWYSPIRRGLMKPGYNYLYTYTFTYAYMLSSLSSHHTVSLNFTHSHNSESYFFMGLKLHEDFNLAQFIL